MGRGTIGISAGRVSRPAVCPSAVTIQRAGAAGAGIPGRRGRRRLPRQCPTRPRDWSGVCRVCRVCVGVWRVCHSSLACVSLVSAWECFRAPALLCERSRRVLALMLQMAVSAQLWALCCHTGCFHTATPLRRPECATRAVAICFSTVLSYILCVCM